MLIFQQHIFELFWGAGGTAITALTIYVRLPLWKSSALIVKMIIGLTDKGAHH
jgi:hypothetical protein